MANSPLGLIKNNIEEYAELLSFIIKADIEIVDEGLNIIAKHSIIDVQDKRSCSSIIHTYAMKEDTLAIIDNPRKNPLCQSCAERNRCLKKMELSYPVSYDGKIIGAIGIVCYNLTQKEAIIRDLELFTAFIKKIDLLILKDLNHYNNFKTYRIKAELLNSALSLSNKAYVTYSKDGNIIDFNQKASGYIGGDISNIEILSYENNTVRKIKLNAHELDVIGTIAHASYDEENWELVLFSETEDYIKNMEFIPETVEPCFIGSSEAAKKLISKITALSKTNSIVFIEGEKGSGKEHAARLIQWKSERQKGNFIKIDCKKCGSESIEGDIFGREHNGNYFPGAIEKAHKGILYIENLEYMPFYILKKLISYMNSKKLSIESKQDFRLMISSELKSKELKEAIEDLGLKNYMPVYVPSLNERIEDIKELFTYFLEKQGHISINDQDMGSIVDIFMTYSWPGNIKELEFVTQMILLGIEKNSNIDYSYIRALISGPERSKAAYNIFQGEDIPAIDELESVLIKKALDKHGLTTEGKKKAAKELGIGIATLYRKIKEFEL
ncbi:sigma-54-dependent transcriptional regulator [Anaeropeptidivorans aminofermentans]|uniref:sigma-54-dependent transcriptional regulator n=1 Tax=Anaeropeptidivorans aminofermentans TaxID=2934315 RepID=UPI0020256491|nr:sigma 54-interacting transcriptional regulator [Anaeropeptidivorans aminofermentans]